MDYRPKAVWLLLAAAGGAAFGGTALLWWHYGAAVFTEIAVAALNLCF